MTIIPAGAWESLHRAAQRQIARCGVVQRHTAWTWLEFRMRDQKAQQGGDVVPMDEMLEFMAPGVREPLLLAIACNVANAVVAEYEQYRAEREAACRSVCG